MIFSVSAALIALFAIITLIAAKKIADPLREVADRIEHMLDVSRDAKIKSRSRIKGTSQLIADAENISHVLDDTVQKIYDLAFALTDTVKSTSELAKTTISMARSVRQINDEIFECHRRYNPEDSRNERGNRKNRRQGQNDN